MSISHLALVVSALLAGTAYSVQSYLESRRPIVLSPQYLMRDLPTTAPARAEERPRRERLAMLSPAPAPAAEATAQASAPAQQACTAELVIELASPAPSSGSSQGQAQGSRAPEAPSGAAMGNVSRWITVRRDGQGREGLGRSGGCSSSQRRKAGRDAGPCSGSKPAAQPTKSSGASAASVILRPTAVRPD